MRHRIINILLLVLLAVTMKSSFATPPSRQSLEELLEVSGLNADLKTFERTLATSAVESASKNKPDDEATKRMLEILLAENLRETFQYTLLLDEVTHFLKKLVTEEDVREALDWYRSELGLRITQAEAAANSVEGQAARQREKNELLSQQDLSTMATQVDNAIGISDAMVDLQINTQKALILAILAIAAPGQDMSKLEHTDWADIKTPDRATLRQPIAEQYQMSFAYSMKAFSQGEREQYRDFLMKPSSIKIINAAITGISKAVEVGAHNFVTELQNDLKNPSPELKQLLSQQAAATTSTTTAPGAVPETETSSENSDW